MKIRLNKSIQGIVGYDANGIPITRLHADEKDVLPVILHNPTHFICDSNYYPNTHIAVFNSQCEIIEEKKTVEEFLEEKYYHVYEDCSKPNLDDPFYTAFEELDDLE